MIIDERVNEYVSQSNYRVRLSNVNIIVPSIVKIKETIHGEVREMPIYDSKDNPKCSIKVPIGNKEMSIQFNDCKNTGTPRDEGPYKYNINVFVIHNTILENNFESDLIDEFVKVMQSEHIPCFLVTSGKGKPASMSKLVKFLPFSNVENFIMQPHPEKFLFTQILFRIINNRSTN